MAPAPPSGGRTVAADAARPAGLTDLRDPLHALVERAGDAALDLYRTFQRTGRVGERTKSDRSPVTAADEAADAVLAEGLPGLLDVPVVSEEGRLREPGRTFWLVDPLDGTREFLAGRDEWTVNVALVQDGAPVAGMVRAPVTGQSWWGLSGEGAWRRDGDSWFRIRCAPPEPGRCRVVASRSHRGPGVDRYLEALRADGLEVSERSYGSSLKLCRVAEGEADVYPRLGPTMEWDTAAADAVLRGAGGSVVDPDGEPLRYGGPDWRNPFFLAGAPGLDWTRYL